MLHVVQSVEDDDRRVRIVEMKAPRQADLYRAIQRRCSVRRYDREPLDAITLVKVREIVAGVKPLIPQNRFEAAVRDDMVHEDLISVLGAYGRLVTPPHALAPYVIGDLHPLEDLGFRVEQIAVRLAVLDIGSCFIGTLAAEDKARFRLGLPEGARIGALLVFGRPAVAVGGRAINTLIRSVLGRNHPPPVERFYFQDTFDNPAVPPEYLAPILEAARYAPSACNVQPWRFLWHQGQLSLFVTRDNPRYGSGTRQQYRFYDGGICMANLSLAMEAFGMEGQWVMWDGIERRLPEHPASLLPLASLVVEEG
jgi:nitroreductase